MIIILIRLQGRQLGIGQLKIENLGILQDTGWRHGFGERVEALHIIKHSSGLAMNQHL